MKRVAHGTDKWQDGTRGTWQDLAKCGKIWQDGTRETRQDVARWDKGDMARCGKMGQGGHGKIWQDGTRRIQPSSQTISKVCNCKVKGAVDYSDCVYSDPTTSSSAASILPLCTESEAACSIFILWTTSKNPKCFMNVSKHHHFSIIDVATGVSHSCSCNLHNAFEFVQVTRNKHVSTVIYTVGKACMHEPTTMQPTMRSLTPHGCNQLHSCPWTHVNIEWLYIYSMTISPPPPTHHAHYLMHSHCHVNNIIQVCHAIHDIPHATYTYQNTSLHAKYKVYTIIVIAILHSQHLILRVHSMVYVQHLSALVESHY